MDERSSMLTRRLGRTGFEVSEIGFGTWGIGGILWIGANDEESRRALHRAADLGVNFFDTALVYGEGHSEHLLGPFLKERRERLFVASKIPPRNMIWPARSGTTIAQAFPYTHIVRSTEKSLKNLGVDTIDLQQLHVWQDDWTDDAEWYEAITALKAEGKIRYVGISVNDHQSTNALRAVASGKIDVVQVIYNIFDQTAEDELFRACIRQDVGVIVRVPFDEGGLTGDITPESTFPAGDMRNNYFRGDRKRQVFERTERLKALLSPEAASLPELALRFCLHPPAVSTVIPGMRSVWHVERNCAVSDGRLLSPALLDELQLHAWNRNFYAGPSD
jgi:aryl-alcohol dehydrogenase-like predicted oxidoreductase